MGLGTFYGNSKDAEGLSELSIPRFQKGPRSIQTGDGNLQRIATVLKEAVANTVSAKREWCFSWYVAVGGAVSKHNGNALS